MMRTLGTLTTLLLTLLLVAGCGDETGDEAGTRAEDGATRTTDQPSGPGPIDGGPVTFTEVALVHETAAGGDVGASAARWTRAGRSPVHQESRRRRARR